MEGHPRLKGPGIAFHQGEDVALVPGGWEGDADRVAGAGDQGGAHVVALDDGPGQLVDLGDGHSRPHQAAQLGQGMLDRKSTRLNSSHVAISYAVFCLKKKIVASANVG